MRTCPDCYVELNLSNREGVQIDYCPTCRGIWLDHGELEKIIQLATRAPYQSYGHQTHSQHYDSHQSTHHPYTQSHSSHHVHHDHHHHDHNKHGHHHHGHYKKHKHEHPVADFLEDIFDIFD